MNKPVLPPGLTQAQFTTAIVRLLSLGPAS